MLPAKKVGAPAPVWYGTCPTAPFAMLVAVLALPVKAPTNVVEVTEVNPAKVVTVEPSDNAVEPMVTELFVNPPLGMLVSDAPDPANPVAVSTPVDGTKLRRVLVVFCGRFPVLAVTHVGYTAVAVATSSVMPVLTAFVAVPAVKLAAVPVMFVPTKALGVPRAGVTSVGLVARTTEPEPVDVVSVGACAAAPVPVEV